MRKKDCEKERRVKEAVIKLILQEGIEGASIAKIAREAGVSPATVYIYYDNKEQMLSSIYHEYLAHANSYLMDRMSIQLTGADLIHELIYGYYDYITEYRQVYSFMEQCSLCPSMSHDPGGLCQIFSLIRQMKERSCVRRYSDETLAAIMFYPVKAISNDFPSGGRKARQSLDELVEILQRALLY